MSYTMFVNGKEGAWIPEHHELYGQLKPEVPPPGTRVSLGKIKGERVGYPELFVEFWLSYHPKRRVGKQEALAAWRGLSAADRQILPGAAKNYTDEQILANTFQTHIKHPHRFIISGVFRDYAEQESNTLAVKAVEYWEYQYAARVGLAYPWKDNERTKVAEDLESLGKESWKDRVWYFFSGKDSKVEDAKKELGTTYGSFRHLLTTVLAYKGLKQKSACKYCQQIDSHHHTCPIYVKAQQDKLDARREVEEGKEEGLAALSGLKDKMKGGKG